MSWRNQFWEDNRLLFAALGGWPMKVYLYVAAATFAFQLSQRVPVCHGALGCGLSILKGAMWGLVWPFYWINFATDFVLLQPYR